MTFLAYLAASTDRAAQMIAADLSGLADGANDLGVVVAHLRGTLGGSEASLAVEEAAYRWQEWRKIGANRIAEKMGRSLGEVLDDPRLVDDTPLRNMRALAVRVPKLPKRLSRKSSP